MAHYIDIKSKSLLKAILELQNSLLSMTTLNLDVVKIDIRLTSPNLTTIRCRDNLFGCPRNTAHLKKK